MRIRVNALLNDTVGTMMTGCLAYQAKHPTDRGCIAGVILGTGTNTCYWERIERIEKYKPKSGESKASGMVVNTECGNFGSKAGRIGTDLPMNRFDVELNAHSNNKDFQIYEKQISGMYLGELVRLVIRSAVEGGAMEADKDALMGRYTFGTDLMAQIASDDSSDLHVTHNILAAHGLTASLAECKFGVLLRCSYTILQSRN